MPWALGSISHLRHILKPRYRHYLYFIFQARDFGFRLRAIIYAGLATPLPASPPPVIDFGSFRRFTVTPAAIYEA